MNGSSLIPMSGLGKPRAPSWAIHMGSAALGPTLDQGMRWSGHADHWLLQPELGLSDGGGSSGSTQSLKDLICSTAKRKQHQSSWNAELSGVLGRKVQ